jgi:hypothetical protein
LVTGKYVLRLMHFAYAFAASAAAMRESIQAYSIRDCLTLTLPSMLNTIVNCLSIRSQFERSSVRCVIGYTGKVDDVLAPAGMPVYLFAY